MRSQRAKSKRLLVIVTSGILRQEDPARNPVGQSYIHDDLIGMGVVVFGSLYPSDAADAAPGFVWGMVSADLESGGWKDLEYRIVGNWDGLLYDIGWVVEIGVCVIVVN